MSLCLKGRLIKQPTLSHEDPGLLPAARPSTFSLLYLRPQASPDSQLPCAADFLSLFPPVGSQHHTRLLQPSLPWVLIGCLGVMPSSGPVNCGWTLRCAIQRSYQELQLWVKAVHEEKDGLCEPGQYYTECPLKT